MIGRFLSHVYWSDMRIVARILLLGAALSLGAVPDAVAGGGGRYVALSAADRREASVAARMAGTSAGRALQWIRNRPLVRQALMGRDGRTIDIHFEDGARVAILPAALEPIETGNLPASRVGALVRPRDSAATGRAIVLEPFASELGRGASAGDAQASALAQAGFHVDELKDSAVTVGVMETLGSYSVVYIETHSGVLPDGDADVVTGETNTRPYATLFNEKSLLQAFVAGDPSGTLYDAITAKFVRLHIGAFPASSVVFLNGCGVLAAPLFWDALHDQNVSTLISWDNDVDGDITDAAAQLLFTNLIQGGTVASAVTQVRAAGLGTSVVGTAVAHIGYIGDGGDTLQRALSGATPTPTPTPTPTDSPTPTVTPTATPVPKAAGKKKCKKGKRLVHGKCRPNKKAK